MMQLLPGGNGGLLQGVASGVMPGKPSVPPLPSRQDPEVIAARERQRQIELNRSGRRASTLTGPRGVQDKLGVVNRPQARESQLLG